MSSHFALRFTTLWAARAQELLVLGGDSPMLLAVVGWVQTRSQRA